MIKTQVKYLHFMDKANALGKRSLARITLVPRRTSSMAHRIQPGTDEEEFPTGITNTSVLFPENLLTISSRPFSPTQPIVGHSNHDDEQLKSTGLLSSTIDRSTLSSNDTRDSTKGMKNYDQGFRNWFNHLTPNQKTSLKLLIVILVIIAIAGAIIPPVYLFIIRQIAFESSFTNITASVCSSSTCIGKETPYRSSMVTTLFTFDGNTNDQSGYVSAIISGGASTASYNPGYLTTALFIPMFPPEYLQNLYLNLAKQSFTLQAWLYVPTFASSNDFGIFSQCDAYSVCLSLSLRNARVALSFDSMNINNNTLLGTTVFSGNVFYHVTVVYDATISQQRIYVNGQIDAVSSGIVNSYQGSSTSLITTIGRSTSFAYPNSYFFGRIDSLTISAGVARNTCQILNDASIIVYYPFSTIDTFNDYGVNLCHGIALGTTTISSGRVGQAISFPSSTSYFQSQCFPRSRPNSPSFSVSLWINPNSVVGGGTLVHISLFPSGNGTCYDLLGLTATGAIVCQWIMSTTNVNSTQGPVIPANTWTHLAVLYSTANGVRLYINGQFSTSSSNTGSMNLYEISAGSAPWYITLGNISPTGSSTPTNCLISSSISSGSFSGAIDEFRVYNREIDNEELCVLANP